jgi:hypothetical protein
MKQLFVFDWLIVFVIVSSNASLNSSRRAGIYFQNEWVTPQGAFYLGS